MEEERTRQDDIIRESEPTVPPRRRSKWPRIIIVILLVPLVLLALWTVIALNWSYSEGNRAGYVQKFSKKGWICKTWEGELAMVNIPGAMQEKFPFTVRDDEVAARINGLMASQVTLTYKQHPGIPFSCFGETQYYVVDVKRVK